jgi:predicted nucleic acid-binding protein
LATILPLNTPVTKKAIELRRNQRKLKLCDAIIGATAVVHNLILITNNVKDFNNIQGLEVIDPHNL